MFTPRLLAVAAVLATVAAVPTDRPIPRPVTTITDADIDDAPWFSFPLFGNLFAPLWRLFPSFADIGPRIIADDSKFQVIVNVKDYKKEDLKVKVKGDFIFVQGSHEAKQDDRDVYASQFFHTYTLPVNSSASAVTAELSSDGFLIVSAPIDATAEKSKDADREVPIVETGVPYQKEETPKEEAPKEEAPKEEAPKEEAPLTTVQPLESDDDRKEPTTPSEREDVTEKDNIIPHGNEIPL